MNWKKIENWNEIKLGDLIICDDWMDMEDKADRFICINPFNPDEICLESGVYYKNDVWYVATPEKPKKKLYAFIDSNNIIRYFEKDIEIDWAWIDNVFCSCRRIHLEYNDVIEVDE